MGAFCLCVAMAQKNPVWEGHKVLRRQSSQGYSRLGNSFKNTMSLQLVRGLMCKNVRVKSEELPLKISKKLQMFNIGK